MKQPQSHSYFHHLISTLWYLAIFGGALIVAAYLLLVSLFWKRRL